MKIRSRVKRRGLQIAGIILIGFLTCYCEIGKQRQYDGFLLYAMESIAFVENLTNLKNAYWVNDDAIDDGKSDEMFRQSIPISFDFADSTKIYLKAIWVKLVGSETVFAQTGLNHPRYDKELRIKKIIEYSAEPVKTALLISGKRLHYQGFLLFKKNSITFQKTLSNLSDQYWVDVSTMADSTREAILQHSLRLHSDKKRDYPRATWIRFNSGEPQSGKFGEQGEFVKRIQITEVIEFSSDSVKTQLPIN